MRVLVVFVNGLQREEPTFELAEENAPEDATIVKVGDEVLPESDDIYDFSFPEEDGKPNPHLWTDPTYGIQHADVVLKTLVAKDPDNADYYTANHQAFVAKATARYEDTLRDDDLPGKPGDPQHSWLGLMRYDYVTMIEGLGGTTTKLDALDVSDVAPDTADYPQ